MVSMVSVPEFRDYLEQKNPTVIIYNDDNNSDYIQGVKRRCYNISEPLRMCLSFSKILVCFNPNAVHLKSNSGTMSFKNVNIVNLDLDNCSLGDVATLYCKAGEGTTAYTLVIR